jgi:glycosyltransferase involved in cell wall biosynthesis
MQQLNTVEPSTQEQKGGDNGQNPPARMRIDWFSNSPLVCTGYGNQTKLFVPLIKQLGYDISIHAFYGHDPYSAPFIWNGIPITGRGFHPYGLDVIAGHAKAIKADIVLTLIDAWIFDPLVMKDLRWVPWFPIDHDPVPPAVLERVRYAFDRIVYSKFALGQLEERDVPAHYVPHAVDTEVFKPMFEKREQFKELIGLPKDKFIVGMVATNKGYPSRKAFEQNISAFKLLKDRHADVFLFLQTWTGEGGNDCVNLPEYCRSIGLQPGRDVIFCDQFVNTTTGFPDNYMNALYNSLDVLLSVSRGEGFGIPILESQAAGTPVIVGDWTSMGEICFSGWKVDRKDTVRDYTRQASYQFLPREEAIAEQLLNAYVTTGVLKRERAREGALAHDVKRVTEKYWQPVLEKIAGRIELTEKLKAQAAVPVPQPSKPLDVREVTA